MLAIDRLHLFTPSKMPHIYLVGMNDAPVALHAPVENGRITI